MIRYSFFVLLLPLLLIVARSTVEGLRHKNKKHHLRRLDSNDQPPPPPTLSKAATKAAKKAKNLEKKARKYAKKAAADPTNEALAKKAKKYALKARKAAAEAVTLAEQGGGEDDGTTTTAADDAGGDEIISKEPIASTDDGGDDGDTNGGSKGAKVTGDPHFVMWSGEKYDFQGGCDLVLVQNPDFNDGQGLYIHIRTKIVRWWSYVESAVIQIGDDTLEVMGGFENKRYFVNGEPGAALDVSGRMPFTIGDYPVRYRHLTDSSFQFKIFLENGQTVILKSVKDFMRVDIENPTTEAFGNSVGLMGSFKGGKMLARDRVTIMTEPSDFGKEWQVLETEPQLFHNVEGVQHPEICAMPTVTEEKRRLQGSISREAAAKACARAPRDERKDCIFDVMATNDLDMAAALYSD